MIELGSTVRDRVSGFEGVVLARLTGLYEAPQVRVHPACTTSSDGALPASVWLEEQRVEVVKQCKTSAGFGSVKGRQ
jgi:hypothetical protein